MLSCFEKHKRETQKTRSCRERLLIKEIERKTLQIRRWKNWFEQKNTIEALGSHIA